MRSVLAALPRHVRTFHLITADFPFRAADDVALLPDSVISTLETSVDRKAGIPATGHGPLHAGDESAEGKQAGLACDGGPNSTERSSPFISPQLASRLEFQWRVAQTPTWLDFSRRDSNTPGHPFHPLTPRQAVEGSRTRVNRVEASYPNFRYATHSEIFRLPSIQRDGGFEELGERDWQETEWRKKALPSFNSMAIESRVGWLPGLVSALSRGSLS